MKYSSESRILLSDFRDVFFQQNPFSFRRRDWQDHQLIIFLEHHPTKVIQRCPFNNGWIENCYGTAAIDMIGTNTPSCSGVTFGTRDAILAYTYLMLEQLDPNIRSQYLESPPVYKENPRACISLGMDQGFHNWLYYSGQLSRFMSIKVYQNGEGMVNTLGSLAGGLAPIKWTLEEWGIAKGIDKDVWIYNWDGEKSPIVHQADRWDRGGFYHSLGALAGIL
jgi:hypothetical protein